VELSRNTVRILVALMTLAICGVLYLQYRLLKNNVELKEESFAHNVNAALSDAANQLEEIDIRDRFFTSAVDSGGPIVLKIRKHTAAAAAAGSDTMVMVSVVTSEEGHLSAQIRGNKLSYTLGEPQMVVIRMYDELGGLVTTILDGRVEAGTHDLMIPKDTSATGVRFIQIKGEHATSTVRWDAEKGYRFTVDADEETRTASIIGKVAETVTSGGAPDLSERLRPGLLDTVLGRVLPGSGVTLEYEYAVRDIRTDSIIVSRMEPGSAVPSSSYSTLLFPGGFSGNAGELLLWFPGYRTHLVRSILPELLLNILFVLIIGACFRFAMKTLRRQREFAGRLTDFINNMTHEFKTPLSTIALSTEALARPDVIGDRSKIEMYGTIIGDEQKRMKSQVDRILELAALEEGEFDFRRDRIDLHDLVARAAANSGVRVRERGGAVTNDLRAESHAVRGDAVHIENVLNSVLDNAEKYSPDAPAIRVATYNADGCVVVSVADRGIGIAPEHLPNIFEKYFRVPTNNLHDVKGFGIGLSYVRLVVERHGGTVRAESSPGQGTTIELKIPVDDGR
jgi:signal transduction histidine kinase